MIAQEVEKDFPELVVEDKNGVKKVRYEGLIPLLIEVAKDLTGRVEAIEMGAVNLTRPSMIREEQMRSVQQAQFPYPPYPYPYYPYPPQRQQPPYPYPQPPQEPQQ